MRYRSRSSHSLWAKTETPARPRWEFCKKITRALSWRRSRSSLSSGNSEYSNIAEVRTLHELKQKHQRTQDETSARKETKVLSYRRSRSSFLPRKTKDPGLARALASAARTAHYSPHAQPWVVSYRQLSPSIWHLFRAEHSKGSTASLVWTQRWDEHVTYDATMQDVSDPATVQKVHIRARYSLLLLEN
jgi:hypothetical protein